MRHMTPSAKQLFWEIINCPDATMESNPACACHTILSVQSRLPFRQVPEPWNGDLDNATVLIIGSNPALDVPDSIKKKQRHSPVLDWCEFEVFPSKDNNWKNWQALMPSNCSRFKWCDASVLDYFENRFNKAIFPPLDKPFIDTAQRTTLHYFKDDKTVSPHKLKNNYWKIYNAYCKAIDPSFVDNSYVVTDFVHCKSGEETGVNEARDQCITFTKKILELFVNNGQTSHTILLFCANKSIAPKLFKHLTDALSSIGLTSTGDSKSVGKSNKDVDILMQTMSSKAGEVNIYYNIPAPSGSARSCSPVRLFPGTAKEITIKW